MLAAMFIQGGITALKAPEAHAKEARPLLDAVSPAVDKAVEVSPLEKRPSDETLIRIDGGVKVVAGTLLALGLLPRLSAAALAASLVPTTIAGHRFWDEEDPQRRQEQEIHFAKNLSMLGGLLIAAADTAGRPSLAWRSRKAAELAAAAAAAQVASVSGTASHVAGRVSGTAHEASGRVKGVAAVLAGLAPAASAGFSARAAKARRVAGKRSARLQKVAGKRSARLQKVAGKRVAAVTKTVQRRRRPGLVGQATRLGQGVVHRAEGVAKGVRQRAYALTH